MLFIGVAAGIFGTIPGLPLRVAQEVLIACGILGILSLFYVKNPWLKMFGLWHVIRTIMFINEPAMFSLYMTAAVLFLYQFIIDISTDEFIPRLLDLLCFILILQSAMIVLQFFGIWIIYTPIPGNGPDEWRYVYLFNRPVVAIMQYPLFSEKWFFMIRQGALAGTTGNTNIASSMFGVGLVAFFRRGWIKYSVILIACLVIMHSLTGIVTAAVVACFYLTSKYGRKAVAGIMAVAATFGVYFYFNETIANTLDFSTRLPAWKIYIKELILMRPWVGWGVAQAPFVARIVHAFIPGELWRHPHNEYINIMLEVGMIGMIPALGYIVSTLWEGIKTSKQDNTCLIVFLGAFGGLFNVIGNFNFHVPAGMVALFFLAMLEYLNKRRSQNEIRWQINSIGFSDSVAG